MEILAVLLVILAILWIKDAYLTLGTISKAGIREEENPVLRFLIKKSKKEFFYFKLIDLLVFSVVAYFLFLHNEFVSYAILSVFILLYVYIDYHNWRIYKEIKG
jgi:hypothetical protein